MDSLNGSSSGCNFIVNPSGVISQQSTFSQGQGFQSQFTQTQFQQTNNSPYFNSFNNNAFNPNLISPNYVYSVAQHLNQVIQSLNAFLGSYEEVEKKSNYVELMSTVFEGVRGEE